jgi:predicted  nucleic acid-binding Zn-ribbon protein
MTDDDIQQPAQRERIGHRAWIRSTAMVGGGLIAGGILAGTLTANAATDDGSTSAPSTNQEQTAPDSDTGTTDGHRGGPGNGDPSQPQRDDEELLTGDTATQVTDVVLAEYPDATIQRVETDSEGVYEAHIVTADDEQLTVQVGEDFTITGTQSHGG